MGDIEVPGVFLEEGAEVELKIWVERGRFEIALFPSENESKHHDCGDCPLREHCGEESEVLS